MIKYSAFKLFQNIETKEIKEIPLDNEELLAKFANNFSWQEIIPENTEIYGRENNKEEKEHRPDIR